MAKIGVRLFGMLSGFFLVLSAQAHTFDFSVEVEVAASKGPVDLWLPLPQSDSWQEVRNLEVVTSWPAEEIVESTYKNKLLHVHFDELVKAQTVQVRATVNRNSEARSVSVPSQKMQALFLQSNELVPVSGELVDEMRAKMGPLDGAESKKAQEILRFVLDNMQYKKTGEGWGNGSTEWACSEKYGNCTDFHALYTSLARAFGMPTRFHIGFSVDEGAEKGELTGYHCWIDVWTKDKGWISVDASAAAKDKEHLERYFGDIPPDRVRLTTGRDLRFGQHGPALNYLVFPYVEVGGKPASKPKTVISFVHHQ